MSLSEGGDRPASFATMVSTHTAVDAYFCAQPTTLQRNMGLVPILVGLLIAASFEIPLQRSSKSQRYALQQQARMNRTSPNPLTSHFDVKARQMEFYAVLYFGTPPQALQVNFNTRSGWMFLFDASCVRDEYNEARSFHSTKSSTFNSTGEVYELDGDGAAVLAYDSVSLGYAEGRVFQQAILLIIEDSDYWLSEGDGEVVRTR